MTDASHEFNQVSEMTSRQRVLAALKREPVDRTPVSYKHLRAHAT